MFDAINRQLKKIQDLDGYQVEASFDPFDNSSIEKAIGVATAKLETWANCRSKDDLLRAALDAYSGKKKNRS